MDFNSVNVRFSASKTHAWFFQGVYCTFYKVAALRTLRYDATQSRRMGGPRIAAETIIDSAAYLVVSVLLFYCLRAAAIVTVCRVQHGCLLV